MNVVIFKPAHVWTRHYPLAHLIASDLLAHPPLLNLRSRRLIADICTKYGVCRATADKAVAIARRKVGQMVWAPLARTTRAA
jgi:hypothetical protein